MAKAPKKPRQPRKKATTLNPWFPLKPLIQPWLRETTNITNLTNTADKGLPAVHGIAADLLAQFGALVKDDRVKQSVGREVRKVMEPLGYTLGKEKSIHNDPVFKNGSTYTR